MLGSPTKFDLTAPVQTVGNGDSIIFKDHSESFNCALWGGTVSVVTSAKSNAQGATRFAYTLSSDRPRNDKVTLATEAAALTLSGRGMYSLTKPGRTRTWSPLERLGKGARINGPDGASLSIAPGIRRFYAVRATGRSESALFAGSFLPQDGKIYFHQATFSPVGAQYAGASQHDCANWDDAGSATRALRRMESTVPH